MAALPAPSPLVSVKPPLFCSGPKAGSASITSVHALLKGQPPWTMLSVKPEVLMVLITSVLLSPQKIESSTVGLLLLSLYIPPPHCVAVLALTVTFLRCAVLEEFQIPPP